MIQGGILHSKPSCNFRPWGTPSHLPLPLLPSCASPPLHSRSHHIVSSKSMHMIPLPQSHSTHYALPLHSLHHGRTRHQVPALKHLAALCHHALHPPGCGRCCCCIRASHRLRHLGPTRRFFAPFARRTTLPAARPLRQNQHRAHATAQRRGPAIDGTTPVSGGGGGAGWQQERGMTLLGRSGIHTVDG